MNRSYEEIFEEAKGLNTCEFVDGQCERGPHCCDNCSFLDESIGCMLNSLLCKLWVCETRRKSMDCDVWKRLIDMWEEAEELGYLVIRGTPATSSGIISEIYDPGGRLVKLPVGLGAIKHKE